MGYAPETSGLRAHHAGGPRTMTGGDRDRRRCRGTTKAGKPCQAIRCMVNPVTGYCPAHGPGAFERLSEAGKKGAEATRAKWRGKGLREEELPELRTPEDAEAWLEALARAVSTGRLGHHEARAATGALREWLRAHEAGAVSERVGQLKKQLDELRGAGKVRVLK